MSIPLDIDLGEPAGAAAPVPAQAVAHARREHWPSAKAVDILLLLEGTFPYVSGGVSSWVNQLILGFPDLTFGAIFMGSQRSDYREMKYTLPANLHHFEAHFLHEPPTPHTQPIAHHSPPQPFEHVDRLHDTLRQARQTKAQTNDELQQVLSRELGQVLAHMQPGGALSKDAFNYSDQTWQRLVQSYHKYCTDPSFVDYFWSVRIMHAPLWLLFDIAQRAPRCRALHTISTGYAGMLGAMLAQLRHCPLLLSEHGIYTKERRIDLFQSNWIRDNRGVFERRIGQVAYFKDLWIRFFEGLGRNCYGTSRHIISLYEANRLRQISDGAPPERTRCIPNGVDVAKFAALRRADDAPIPSVLCLIGRVVPIKDIKTFVRAMRSLVDRVPEAQGWIAGPEDEDPAYADECRLLVDTLGLKGHVHFLGFQKMQELLPKIGLLVLSSISEGLPLVVLESYAAGIPCVTTDVGACRQLAHGLNAEDQALGAAGAVVQIADPQALAQACVPFLTQPQRWHQARQAAIARVERFYRQETMFESYRALYEDALNNAERDRKRGSGAACPMSAAPASTH